ncbi:glycerate kinase [Maribacter algarum]|uniref:Glycerate kinase n=1 Tax=Maribacter algarum (ex Zhang et al. 2020) TaxID=2578118 RepID=A0A5S3PHC1_9FLAO|nr:glycerate kinase [Maribacter algarum]TMM53639.1 glycerate kinase [Maribacter algarum]
MKILLIPDKFKGSLTAREVIESMRRGINSVFPDAIVHSVRASDGGDGFLDTILANVNCDAIEVDTVDSLGRDIKTEYLYNPKNNSAYIELAKTSGLALLNEGERNVMKTSTFGTGLLIKDAILKGSTSIYLGIGGSATNDVGLGIAEALGYYFLDNNGNQLAPNGANLSKINSIHKSSNSISLKGVSFFAINDVDNPLYGPEGAAHIYGKQKGGSPEEIEQLDFGMQDFANLVQLQTKKDDAMLSGSGAAGGTAYGLKIFCDAEFISGIDFVLGISKVEEILRQNEFDYIITGEGKIDSQTLYGKLIKGVVELGNRFDVPVVALCGQLDLDKKEVLKFENLTVLEIQDTSKPLNYNMENAGLLIEKVIQSFLKK